MILGFKQEFPDRTPTFFEQKILAGVGLIQPNILMGAPKLHSLRAGKRWRAGMSIQMAYGVRTGHYRQFNKGIKELSTCISTQRVFMTYDFQLEVSIDGRYLMPIEKAHFINNDGLTRDEFVSWFFPKYPFEWSGQIIHWTNFKY